MTAKKEKKHSVKYFSKNHPFTASLIIIAAIMFCAVFLSDELANYAKNGFLLSIKVIIPSVFPFLILTDIAIPHIRFEEIGFLRRTFERCFKISGCGISALICGLLCGFPIGAKIAASLYTSSKITREECERLMVFSNNASPGYVISAIGVGLRASVYDGVILYISLLASSIITGILLGKRQTASVFTFYSASKEYDFVSSVKDSVNVCLNICGFVTFFSILTGLIRQTVKNKMLLAFVLPFMEIGNACAFLSDADFLSVDATLILTAFSISFSGLSVYAQTKGSLNSIFNVSFKKYFFIKLVQGCISAFSAFAIIWILNFI